jgi:hypothetical protein
MGLLRITIDDAVNLVRIVVADQQAAVVKFDNIDRPTSNFAITQESTSKDTMLIYLVILIDVKIRDLVATEGDTIPAAMFGDDCTVLPFSGEHISTIEVHSQSGSVWLHSISGRFALSAEFLNSSCIHQIGIGLIVSNTLRKSKMQALLVGTIELI